MKGLLIVSIIFLAWFFLWFLKNLREEYTDEELKFIWKNFIEIITGR